MRNGTTASLPLDPDGRGAICALTVAAKMAAAALAVRVAATVPMRMPPPIMSVAH
jgi:hypothetical protein